MRSFFVTGLSVVVTVVAGCNAGVAPDQQAPDRQAGSRVPAKHRASSEVCTGDRPAGAASTGSAGSCQSDVNCTDGRNGRCTGDSRNGFECTYDVCETDNDCAAGTACACDAGSRSRADVCLGGNCQVDAQCGAGGYCSPSAGCNGLTVGFYCHTPDDECIDDGDCTSGSCAYDSFAARWTCAYGECPAG